MIKIGKPVTKKLLELLPDSERGIMAHYILTRIWIGNNPEPLKYYYNSDKSQVIQFNGLTFTKDASGKLIVKEPEIAANRDRWLKYLPRQYR